MPRDVTITKTVYSYDELSDKAKDKARDYWRDGYLDYEWWDGVYDWADDVFKAIGITSDEYVKCMDGKMRRVGPDIRFSGFSSQGDGACFEGSYSYKKGALKAVKAEAPKEEELHRIVRELQNLQSKNFYKLEAKLTHIGRHYHAHCVEIDVTKDGTDYNVPADVHEGISDLMRDIMDWIYKKLEKEHDYLLSDENIDESIKCSEVEFNENGTPA